MTFIGDKAGGSVTIDSKGAYALAQLLVQNCGVTRFTLSGVHMNEAAAAELGRGLRQNWNLVALNLSHNHICKKDIGALLKYFSSNSALRELNLQDTALDDACANVIANKVILSPRNRLRVLNIADNYISTRKLESIAHIVKVHCQLHQIYMDGNKTLLPGDQATPQKSAPPRTCALPFDRGEFDQLLGHLPNGRRSQGRRG
jgi:Ran GTPase-activating protein (RanGAP) involved in mRNA processing and transport